jgi:hypothetical protein
MRRRSILIRAAKNKLPDNARESVLDYGVYFDCGSLYGGIVNIHIISSSFVSLSKLRSGSRLGSAGGNLQHVFS